MSGVAALAVVAAIAGGVGWLVVKGRQIEQRADFDRAVRARKLGWRYDGTRDGRIDYRFAGGRDGIDWSMWHDGDRGDRSPSPKAVWLSGNLRTDRLALVILGRRRHALESGAVGRLVMGVVTGIASAAGGHDAAADKVEFYDTAVLLEEGRDAPDERLVVAVAPDMPRDWLDDDLGRRLARWPQGRSAGGFRPAEAVEVTLGPGGLSITVRKMPTDMAHWQHLAELGEQLALRLTSAPR
jgi:hypothetical protein